MTRTVAATATPQPLPDLWDLPDRVVPEAFGVEIHFTRASHQELDYLAAGGFKWVRMDMFWHTIERDVGRYDFSEYDALVAALRQRNIRIVFILDYGNPLYDHGYPPTSASGQAAFARFAAVAADRYRDKGILWDLWNEPNLDHFWIPEANADAYGRLALLTASAIRRVDPTALIVGPAVCGFDWKFWHALGRMGLFQQLDAVTFHAYGVEQPEDLIGPYLDLRALLNAYTPGWSIPILSGEWGFATTPGGWTEGQQAQYLSRQWLFNLAYDIDLSIWYDWRDGGLDPDDPEQNFGTVRHAYGAKPSYFAAQTLATTLSGYRFLRRIPLERADDYLLLFQNGNRVALTAWTTGEAHILILPISVYDVQMVGMMGEESMLESEGQGLALPVDQSPRYLLFRPDQPPLYLGGWRPLNTINNLSRAEGAAIPMVFEDSVGIAIFGELQVWIDGQLRGQTTVYAPPMTRQQPAATVNLTGLHGSVQAELRLVMENSAMAPLQTAAIWLQITD